MNKVLLSKRTVFALMFAATCVLLGNNCFTQSATAQAEEILSQNSSFLQEIEEISRGNLTPSTVENTSAPAVQNQPVSAGNQNRTLRTDSLPLPQQELTEGSDGSSDMIHQPGASVVVSGENAYIVWWTNKSGNWEVMYRGSNDNGQTFKEEVNLSNSQDTDSENAALVASGNNVFVSWWEKNITNGTSESVFRTSNDSGLTFGPILRLSGNQTIGQTQIRPDFLMYENSSYGIKVKYPSDWRLRLGEADNDGVTDIAGFYAPFENRLDNYQERVWISTDILLGQNMTLEDYSDRVVSHNNATLGNFTLLDRDTDFGVLADHPAYRLVYTSQTQDGSIIKQLEIGTIINDEVYYLIYYAEPDKYRGLLPVVQDIINSFDINQ